MTIYGNWHGNIGNLKMMKEQAQNDANSILNNKISVAIARCAMNFPCTNVLASPGS